MELYYNPKGTVLAERAAVWVRGGFNRWRHAQSFGPLLMTPPGEGGEHFLVGCLFGNLMAMAFSDIHFPSIGANTLKLSWCNGQWRHGANTVMSNTKHPGVRKSSKIQLTVMYGC